MGLNWAAVPVLPDVDGYCLPRCCWCYAAYALTPGQPCHYCARALALADTIAYDSEGAVVAPEGDTHD